MKKPITLLCVSATLIGAFSLLTPFQANALPLIVVSRAALGGNDFID